MKKKGCVLVARRGQMYWFVTSLFRGKEGEFSCQGRVVCLDSDVKVAWEGHIFKNLSSKDFSEVYNFKVFQACLDYHAGRIDFQCACRLIYGEA